MKEGAYQKSLKFTTDLQEHSPTWMEMEEKERRDRFMQAETAEHLSCGLDVVQRNDTEDNARQCQPKKNQLWKM